MRRLAIAAFALVMLGCAAPVRMPPASQSAVQPGGGALSVRVLWPRRTQVVPTDTTQIGLTIRKGAVVQTALNLDRKADQGEATASVTLPADTYTLEAAAYNAGGTLTAQGTASATVLTNQIVCANLVLAACFVPALTAYQPNAAPGDWIELNGVNLAANGASDLAVELGAVAGATRVVSDGLAYFQIPAGATNGEITLRANGVPGKTAYPFTTIATFSFMATTSIGLTANGSNPSARIEVAVRDSANRPIDQPYVTWIPGGEASRYLSLSQGTGSTCVVTASKAWHGPGTVSGLLRVQAGSLADTLPVTLAP